MFNLINNAWLPVIRQSGARDIIRPAQITSQFDSDPIVAFNWGRSDLDAAAREFIIGLLATTSAPADGKSWRAWWTKPPSEQQLHKAFEPIKAAFNFDEPGAGAFMQDYSQLQDSAETEIQFLPIESPGAITIKQNADVFQKRDILPFLSRAGAAIILYALQSYSGFAGVGHRVAVRGRGPLTTLVAHRDEPSLWRTLWLNTPKAVDGAPVEKSLQLIFPWMAPTRTSLKNEIVTPEQTHPLLMYWGAPTRLRLVFTPNTDKRPCPMTGAIDDTVVVGFRAQNYGASYGSVWSHPLTPSYLSSDKVTWLPVHGQPGGIPYTHWPSLAGIATEARRPAAIIPIAESRLQSLGMADNAWLMVDGYDMDNAKARAVFSARMPVYSSLGDYTEAFHAAAQCLVEGARRVANLTTNSIKTVVDEMGDSNACQFADCREVIYAETEAAFYAQLQSLHDALSTATGDPAGIIKQNAEEWLRVLRATSMRLFDARVPLCDLSGTAVERAAQSRWSLSSAFSGYGKDGKFILTALGLPLPESTKAKKKKAAA